MGVPAPLGVDAAGLPNAGDQANAVIAGTIKAVGPTKAFAFRGPMNVAIWASVVTTLTTTAASFAATVLSATGLAAGSAINSVNVPPGATVGAINGTNVTVAVPPVALYASVDTNGLMSGLASTAGLVGATVTVPSTAEGYTLPANTTVTAVVTTAVAASANSPGVPGVVQLSAAPTAVPSVTGQQPFEFARTANAITVGGADATASFTDALLTYDATVQVERSFDGGATWIVANTNNTGSLAQYVDKSSVNFTVGEPEKNVLYRLNCIEYTSGTINYRISQTGGAAESLAIGPLSGG